MSIDDLPPLCELVSEAMCDSWNVGPRGRGGDWRVSMRAELIDCLPPAQAAAARLGEHVRAAVLRAPRPTWKARAVVTLKVGTNGPTMVAGHGDYNEAVMWLRDVCAVEQPGIEWSYDLPVRQQDVEGLA